MALLSEPLDENSFIILDACRFPKRLMQGKLLMHEDVGSRLPLRTASASAHGQPAAAASGGAPAPLHGTTVGSVPSSGSGMAWKEVLAILTPRALLWLQPPSSRWHAIDIEQAEVTIDRSHPDLLELSTARRTFQFRCRNAESASRWIEGLLQASEAHGEDSLIESAEFMMCDLLEASYQSKWHTLAMQRASLASAPAAGVHNLAHGSEAGGGGASVLGGQPRAAPPRLTKAMDIRNARLPKDDAVRHAVVTVAKLESNIYAGVAQAPGSDALGAFTAPDGAPSDPFALLLEAAALCGADTMDVIRAYERAAVPVMSHAPAAQRRGGSNRAASTSVGRRYSRAHEHGASAFGVPPHAHSASAGASAAGRPPSGLLPSHGTGASASLRTHSMSASAANGIASQPLSAYVTGHGTASVSLSTHAPGTGMPTTITRPGVSLQDRVSDEGGASRGVTPGGGGSASVRSASVPRTSSFFGSMFSSLRAGGKASPAAVSPSSTSTDTTRMDAFISPSSAAFS